MELDKRFNIFGIPKNIEQSNKIKSYNQSYNDRKYYNFTIGQSPFPIPNHISDALAKSTQRGEYSPPMGISGLNESIAKFYRHYHKVNVNSDAIFSGLGTKNILFILIGLLEGTYFLPVPAWGGYEPFIKYHNRNIEKIYLNPKNNYEFNIEELESKFKSTKGQKIFIFNSPHNPSGKVFSAEEMKKLSDLFKEYQVIVLSDEIYALTTYNPKKYVSFYNFYPEKTFLLGGISKDRGAAGYRFGVCIVPKEDQQIIFNLIKRTISNFYISLPTPIQFASKKAYEISIELDNYFKKTRMVYQRICKMIVDELKPIKNAKFYVPEAGFYITIDLNEFSQQFKLLKINEADQLLDFLFDDPYNVALVPGTTMGLNRDDFTFRIAFVDFNGKKLLEDFDLEFNKEVTHMMRGIEILKKFLMKVGDSV